MIVAWGIMPKSVGWCNAILECLRLNILLMTALYNQKIAF